MILAKLTKQPAEIESYSIVYDDDLNENEDLQSSYHSLSNHERVLGRSIKSADYTATLADDRIAFLVASDATLTLPAGMALTEVYVCHISPTGLVTIASDDLIDGAATKTLSQQESAVLVRSGGTWTTEAYADSSLIIADEQRIRVFVGGGVSGNVYKAEVTATTNAGRVMEDEIIIKVRES